MSEQLTWHKVLDDTMELAEGRVMTVDVEGLDFLGRIRKWQVFTRMTR